MRQFFHYLSRVACLAAVAWTAHAQRVLIHEIMYHPASEDPKEEYIELFNAGSSAVNLLGWRFSKGVSFRFPDVTIAPGGYVVVAADPVTFRAKHPAVPAVVGGWEGALSNSGEDLDLDDGQGQRVDSVRYADEGDWAVRIKGPEDSGHRGWIWAADHNGGGKSLELRNPSLSNNHGQNWAASTITGGTPGAPNSVFSANIPPMILETKHAPLVPKSSERIAISARIVDEQPEGISVTLRFRLDGQPTFAMAAMRDDGLSGDGGTRDDVYGVFLPPQTNHTIVEFYLEARDAVGNTRTWPAPALIDGQPAQAANLLLQVDDSAQAGALPVYRLLMKEADRSELAALGQSFFESQSHAQMNGMFLCFDGTGSELRYGVSIRNRGNGSRNAVPNNYRVNFRSDHPWKGVSALNLNSQFPHSQLAGSAIFQKAGLWAGDSRAVEVRVNNANLAAATWPMFGIYVANEVLDSEFTNHQFPKDPSGNVYRAIRLGLGSPDPGTRATNFNANLTYLGDDPTPYRVNYFKWTNTSEDDWTDLIGLTRALSPATPDDLYAREVNRVLNAEQWLRFLALNTLLDNNETSISNGDGDDYFLYRGREDPRFVLLPYDLDTVLGQGNTPGLTNNGIFRATTIPALNRFLKSPEFAPRYCEQLKRLIDTTFSAAQVDALLDQVLSRHVPATVINDMKAFAAARRAFVRSLIPQRLSVVTDLPLEDGYFRATTPVLRLSGSANAIQTRTVRVDGAPVFWSAWEGKWLAENVVLHPGINRILVQALDERGIERERQFIDVRYDTGQWTPVAGILTSNTVWRLRDSPISITGTTIIPAGVTLSIEAGTTVYFQPDSGLLVRGRLLAEGSDLARIRLTRAPGAASPIRTQAEMGSTRAPACPDQRLAGQDFVETQPPNDEFLERASVVGEGADLSGKQADRGAQGRVRSPSDPNRSDPGWRGIYFQNSAQANQMLYCDMEYADAADQSIRLDQSVLLIDHTTWTGTRKTILELNNSSLTVRNSVFPPIDNSETIHGTGMPTDGHVIIEKNVFGKTTGYSDVIDFTGGKRPGPIIQILDNTFLGGADDGLDLDGTDAHIEGNVFQAFHKDNPSDSSSNAIATDFGSEIVAVRNVFFDNDHAVLLKGGATLISQNNTMVGSSIAAINFGEPERGVLPGRAARFEGDILWGNRTNFQNLIGSPNGAELTVNRSIIGGPQIWPGVGNLNSDPRFVNPTNDFHLRPGSPAIGSGPSGLDLGAFVPAGAAISGEPPAISHSSTATLTVGGPGITHYKWRLNDGAFSGEQPVSQPIALAGLTNGRYTVFVIGKNSAGVWQLETQPTASRPWTVDRASSGLVINEVLARCETALALGDSSPGFVELSNEGDTPLDLSGMSLSNDPRVPRKFVFPSETLLPPGGFLAVFADNRSDLAGLHLGFTLHASGDSLRLFDNLANGGGQLDSITFGLQVPDLSVGRLSDGNWGLTRPTFASRNIPMPLGDLRTLQFSEWLANGGTVFENDFVELHNPEPVPVALGGLFLSDSPVGYPERHRIAPLSFLAANGFAVLLADGQPELGADHLNFQLASEQGALGLFAPGLSEIDGILYGPQRSGISEGRTANAPNAFAAFAPPTPGRPNLPTAPALDGDSDGLPDDWETAHGFDPISPDDAGTDFDGDGQTNLAEFQAGTNPRDGQDALRIEAAVLASVGLRIRFTAVAGRTYAIQYADSLNAGPWLKLGDVEADSVSRRTEIIDPVLGSPGERFYRLVLRRFPASNAR